MGFRVFPFLIAACAVLPALPARAAAAPQARLSAAPAEVRLSGPDAAQQLVAWEAASASETVDRTATAQYSSMDPRVARVSPGGLVTPVADGSTRVRIRVGTKAWEVPVSVRGTRVAPSFSFANDIAPILSRAGCNAGTCHGKAEGQHGFKLSVFGYDLPADYQAITRAAEGRRIARTDPSRSLLLLKATGQLPHGGGARFAPDSAYCAVLARWIAAGAPSGPPDAPTLSAVDVFPRERSLFPKGVQQLLVTARYSDGSTRDVTREARFGSNSEPIAAVGEDGRVRTTGLPGEAAVMVSYRGAVAVSRVRVPRPPEPGVAASRPPERTVVDGLVWNRLEKLRIRPSEPATDEEFLRRASLDLIGMLPSPEEARAFLAECKAERKGSGFGVQGSGRDKGTAARPGPGSFEPRTLNPEPSRAREKLVDKLLERPEYADFWALKWADLLRVNKERLGAKGAYTFYQWIRASLAANVPYDRFIRELVTAEGISTETGAVNFYRVLTTPQELAASVSQVFLGVRIECAQCHHHPFEKWSQDDYYGMVAYFTRLKSRPAGASAAVLIPGGDGEAVNPRSGLPVPPHPLEGPPSDLAGLDDRRERLAEWMTRPDNRFVSRMIVNRLWAHFMGRGLVEPVDDFRDTNPPTNPELLDALARHLVENRYDLKAVIRAIMNSQAYQLSGRSNQSNAGDEQNFSRAYPKRLSAEVLLDAISTATGSPPEFPGLPKGVRAVQMWDSEWSLQWQSYFLNAFGRPPRTSPCECERSQEPTIAQVLHLMNAPEIQAQLAGRDGRAHRLAATPRTDAQVIEELFLAAYARRPTPKEQEAALALFAKSGDDRSRAAEDLLWALINTTEFVFNH
jgi:hypothetical protein